MVIELAQVLRLTILLSPSLKDSVSEYRSLIEFSNGSDHVPVILTLDIDINMHKIRDREFKPNVAWQKCDDACIGKYQNSLDENLLQINPNHEAWSCRDNKCTEHFEFIQNVHNRLIRLWLEASNSSLPHTAHNANNRHKPVPGWNEHVRDRKRHAKECHDAWIQSRKPQQGNIAKEKRSLGLNIIMPSDMLERKI